VELCSAENPFILESGQAIGPVTIAYETYGTLTRDGTNAILICHALTANAHASRYHGLGDKAPGWWDGLIGPGKAFDTEKFFVVCPNILGSCYGTTGPTSINPFTGSAYHASFPRITVRDIVNAQKLLLDHLGVNRLASLSGSSLGGMQVLEWGIMFPEFCETIIPISTAAQQTAWCIALNAIARAAITGDPAWNNGEYTRQPARGLALARMVGMTSYRSPEEFEKRFGRELSNGSGSGIDHLFEVESYLHHQGKKLVERFDANTYVTLSHATDSHDVARGRGDIESALGEITSKALCIGVSSDIRYPTADQHHIVRLIPDAQYAEIQSIHGHDAFLIEFAQLGGRISEFLKREIR
jgi:homoserine O-acetyltransferase